MLRRAIQTTRGRLILLLSAVAVLFFGTAALAHFALDLFPSYGEALWSAVLHLLDPSSLHDDHTGSERVIGLVQVIAGLVLLVGVLFTLIAETVGRSIERLGRVDPPIHASGHLLVMGGAERLTETAAALTAATELGSSRSRVVFLAPAESRPDRHRLLAELQREAAPLKVMLAFGDLDDESGFELAGAERAETILLLPKTGGAVISETIDVEVIQSGLALKEYLEERRASPRVRVLFRRGHHVDAAWSLFPTEWDAIVSDRIVSGIFRAVLTGRERVPEIESLVDPTGAGDASLLRRAREKAAAAGRPLRLTIVGCGARTQALMEDLAEAGRERFELTMLVERDAFDLYLGRRDPAGLRLEFQDTWLNDIDLLRDRITEADPDVVLVSPSPTSDDAGTADAQATLTVLNLLRILDPETPVLAEMVLRESVERLPSADPRLLPLSVVQAVSDAVGLTIFDPDRAEALERSLDHVENEA